jgi:hypothetical protein
MLNVIYAGCHIQVLYAECHLAECCYAECHLAVCYYAECRGAKLSIRVKSLLALTGNIRLVVKFLEVTIVKLSNRGDFLVSVDVCCQILNNRYKCNNGVL